MEIVGFILLYVVLPLLAIGALVVLCKKYKEWVIGSLLVLTVFALIGILFVDAYKWKRWKRPRKENVAVQAGDGVIHVATQGVLKPATYGIHETRKEMEKFAEKAIDETSDTDWFGDAMESITPDPNRQRGR